MPCETPLPNRADQFPINDTLFIKQEGKLNPLICLELVSSHSLCKLQIYLHYTRVDDTQQKKTAVFVAAKT